MLEYYRKCAIYDFCPESPRGVAAPVVKRSEI